MTVHILIGRVGAGKTAFARAQEHERNAVRFSLDDWMTHLYGHHMPRDLFDSRVQLCMDLILALTERLAASRVEVVLDCGFWKRETRQECRDRLTRSGTTVQAWYFDTPAHIRWSRLENRNRSLPAGTFEITREMFELFDQWFEPPDASEDVRTVRPAANSKGAQCSDPSWEASMNEIEAQVLQAENELLGSLRSGDLARGVEMHLNAPEYRNIWNGEMKTYSELSTRIAAAREKGLASIDYQVASREMFTLDESSVMTTLVATETTHMTTGESKTSGRTIISILWRKMHGKWWLGYLHASEEPQGAANPVWQEP